MLQHNNPFRRFLLSLSPLKKFNLALANLEEAGAKPNLIMFALWTAQQQLQFTEDWQQVFGAFFNWNQDFTASFASQVTKLKHLAERSEFNEDGPLHQLIKHLNQAKNLASQQEQSLLYFYYQERQGLEAAANRQVALIHNLEQSLPKATALAVSDLEALLILLVEDEDLAEYLDLLKSSGTLTFS